MSNKITRPKRTTKEILRDMDWGEWVGSSTQEETMFEIAMNEITHKQAIKYVYVKKNKKLLKELTSRQFEMARPYFFKIGKYWHNNMKMKFLKTGWDEKLRKKVQQILK